MIWRRFMLAVSALELVPIHVLDRVGRMARAFSAHVELFHCLYEPETIPLRGGPTHAGTFIAERIEERRRRLERLADILLDQHVTVSSSVRWDIPTYESIVRQALRYKPDLLIVPAVSVNETLRTFASQQERLIEHLPCAVLFLKTHDVYSKGSIVAAVDPHHSRDEFGDIDELTIGAARTLSGAFADVPVHLLYAERHRDGAPASAGAAAIETRMFNLAALHDIPERDVRVQFGQAHERVLEYMHETGAQTLVVGVRSDQRFDYAFAERLVDELECDLLIVKTRYQVAEVSARPAPAVLPHSL